MKKVFESGWNRGNRKAGAHTLYEIRKVNCICFMNRYADLQGGSAIYSKCGIVIS